MSDRERLYVAVGLGSAFGSVARFLCSLWLLVLLGPAFPWGTLAVNGLGSFLIGLYAAVSGPDGRWRASPAQRQFMIPGFCAGFTTFSIFSLESLLLAERQAFGLAVLYVVASLVIWLGAVWLGHRLAIVLNDAPAR